MSDNDFNVWLEKEWNICKRTTPKLAMRLEKERGVWFEELKKEYDNSSEKEGLEIKMREIGKITKKLNAIINK